MWLLAAVGIEALGIRDTMDGDLVVNQKRTTNLKQRAGKNTSRTTVSGLLSHKRLQSHVILMNYDLGRQKLFTLTA